MDEQSSEKPVWGRKYRRDGTPYIDTLEEPALIQWAKDFEKTNDRIVGQSKTLYGERLSTVWLGLDHSFGAGPPLPPLIFETMLFAPSTKKIKCRMMDGVLGIRGIIYLTPTRELCTISPWRKRTCLKMMKSSSHERGLRLCMTATK